MIRAGTLLRAPRLYKWEVSMIRRFCMNEGRNLEQRRAEIMADSKSEAMTEAERIHSDFKAVSARRSP